MAMSFDEKFTKIIQNFENVIKPDYTSKELNYYADFIELVVLLSNDDGITLGDIQDKFFGEKDYNSAKERDNDESLLIEIFLLIEERIILYSDDYPFIYENLEILKLKTVLTDKNKLYITLLISSKLNIFNEFRSELTSEFESISYNVLKEFMPAKAIIKDFGKNTAYTGNAINKIKELAHDLNIKIDEYELSHVNERNYQERGLDLVGWVDFNDKSMNKIIFLCQCACGKEYESKQHDTRRFQNYYHFYKSNPQHTMFIPYSLINTKEKKFYHSDLIEKDYLIFERKRILEYFTDANFSNTESYKIVNECISYSRAI
jgi:hypothetical protein